VQDHGADRVGEATGAWFDESKHWTNDTLRSALLAAAGLTAPLKAPVQLGGGSKDENRWSARAPTT